MSELEKLLSEKGISTQEDPSLEKELKELAEKAKSIVQNSKEKTTVVVIVSQWDGTLCETSNAIFGSNTVALLSMCELIKEITGHGNS